nr:MerR family transcriptional regulator [Micromonospora sp. HNM0581]
MSAGVVAKRLGVAVTTLRTWHQRYGLGPSEHVPGHHRRYTSADLARLEVMRRLTTEGVSPAEAARWARQSPGTLVARGGRRRRDGGGTTIPLGRAGPAARGLARAALRLDGAALSETISCAIAADGVIATWDRLLCPLLVGIGQRYAATGELIEVEHLVSRCVSAALGAAASSAVASTGTAHGPSRVLLSCADEEQHSLPLEALAAALAEAGVGHRMLGARVPPAALLAAVDRTGPVAVVLWSQTRATADPAQLTALLTAPSRPVLVIAAGPGWPARALPVGVVRPADLTEAVSLTVAVSGPLGRQAAS